MAKGIKIWTADIKNIYVWTTPVKEVYVWTTKVRPTWWKPWANTIAYYPFDDQSSTQITDATWNWYNLTWWTMPSYSLVSWTNYAGNYNNYNSGTVQGHSFYSSLSSYTLLFWAKPINWSWNQFVTQLYDSWSYQTAIIYWYVSWKFELFAVSWSAQRVDIATSVSTNTWYLLWYTKSWTTVTVYCNGTAWTSITYNSTPKNYLYLWWSNAWDRFHWMLDNVIIENKARAAQEISDYYNSTKWNYGL